MRVLVLALGAVACVSHAPSREASTRDGAVRVTREVDAHRVACTGVARTRCLRVRVLPDTSWRSFYDPIEGFTYEEGYRWRLEVERRQVPNPPADGSSLAYRLVRVISTERDR
jgi:hypothetical protein